MSGVKRQRGPAVTDISPIAAENFAEQQNAIGAVENASKRLALNDKMFQSNLDLSRQALDLDKSNMNWMKDQGDISNAFSFANLGVSGLGALKARNEANQRMKYKKELISDLEKAADRQSLFYSKYLKML